MFPQLIPVGLGVQENLKEQLMHIVERLNGAISRAHPTVSDTLSTEDSQTN